MPSPPPHHVSRFHCDWKIFSEKIFFFFKYGNGILFHPVDNLLNSSLMHSCGGGRVSLVCGIPRKFSPPRMITNYIRISNWPSPLPPQRTFYPQSTPTATSYILYISLLMYAGDEKRQKNGCSVHVDVPKMLSSENGADFLFPLAWILLSV